MISICTLQALEQMFRGPGCGRSISHIDCRAKVNVRCTHRLADAILQLDELFRNGGIGRRSNRYAQPAEVRHPSVNCGEQQLRSGDETSAPNANQANGGGGWGGPPHATTEI
jgi:hypothetical protein